MSTFDFIIIGSGIAGVSAAETLRKHAPSASICVISKEPHNPYSKVLLPFWLKGKIRQEQLFIRGRNFWEKNNIAFVHGTVRSIRRDKKEIVVVSSPIVPASLNLTIVKFSDGAIISYGKLLIASGAYARKLDFAGSDLSGVFYFRNLDDATAIKDYFDTLTRHREPSSSFTKTGAGRGDLYGDCRASLAMTGLQPVIYGASFIALEFAGIFAYLGIKAKIFFRGPYFWHRLLDEQGGKLIESFLEQAGMEIHREEEIAGIQGIEQIDKISTQATNQSLRESAFILQQSAYGCNFLGLGVGLEPNLEFAREAGLEINRGIVTNEYLETNDPNIFAAGDVAEFYDVVIGRHHVLGNWLNSDMQGRTAAMNMLGMNKAFELVSSYSFTFDGRKSGDGNTQGRFDICVIGDTGPEKPFDEHIITDENKYMRIFSKNDCCVGAILVNNTSLRSKVTQAIKLKSSVKDLMNI